MLNAIDRAGHVCRVAGILALTLASAHGTEPPLAFDTAGGDAWTFEKTVELTVPAGRCDTVEIIAPTGSTIVSPIRERIRARISLEPGENVIEAECHKNGSLNGKPPKQRAIRTMLLKGMGVTSNAALSRRTTIAIKSLAK